MHNKKSLNLKMVTSFLLVTMTSCITQINDEQLKVYKEYETKNLLYVKKDPNLAHNLGFFPGAGFIYTGDYDHAAGSVITWVLLGPIWQPINAEKRAQLINFQETEKNIKKSFKKELYDLDNRLYEKQITKREYNNQVLSMYDSYTTYSSEALKNYKKFIEDIKRENHALLKN